ncbi:unnamed protein product [Rhizophagus irregularis]|nr:unnamed protein product [Rhizophagus irregularis]
MEDSILMNLQPSMKWNDWIEDIKKAIENSNYHSDEVSESDIEKFWQSFAISAFRQLAKTLVSPATLMMICLSNREDSNHVLHIYDKPWRSSVIRKLLQYADEMEEKTQNIKMARKRWYDD